MSITLTESLGSFFMEAVDEAVHARRVEATHQATMYLAGLLTDFSHPAGELEHTFDRPLAFLLDDALHATGRERFQRLKALGDGALYLSGFFGEHVESRGLDPRYTADMGAAAYSGAAAMLQRRQGGVFDELALKFGQFVEVLTVVAEQALAQQAQGGQGALKLYERWLKSGSQTLAAELVTRGIVPRRGHGGVH